MSVKIELSDEKIGFSSALFVAYLENLHPVKDKHGNELTMLPASKAAVIYLRKNVIDKNLIVCRVNRELTVLTVEESIDNSLEEVSVTLRDAVWVDADSES